MPEISSPIEHIITADDRRESDMLIDRADNILVEHRRNLVEDRKENYHPIDLIVRFEEAGLLNTRRAVNACIAALKMKEYIATTRKRDAKEEEIALEIGLARCRLEAYLP